MDDLTIKAIVLFICGDSTDAPKCRTQRQLRHFFGQLGIDTPQFQGESRAVWATNVMLGLNGAQTTKVVSRLAMPVEYDDDETLQKAVGQLNKILRRDKLEISDYDDEGNPVIAKYKPNLSRIVKGTAPPSQVEAITLPGKISNGEVKQSLDFWNAEYQKCAGAGAYLAAVVLLGAMLEAALLLALKKHPKDANQCPSAPKRDGKVKVFGDWTLSEMIDVARTLGWIGKYEKGASQVLRDYRNFIHANQLMKESQKPDAAIVDICSRIFQKAIDDLANGGLLE